MVQVDIQRSSPSAYEALPLAAMSPKVEARSGSELNVLLACLSPASDWGHRQRAARKLGYLGCREAVPALLNALAADPFWMVRQAIIQALEKIGDPAALPTLQEVAMNDGFQIVRSCAAGAIERISGR